MPATTSHRRRPVVSTLVGVALVGLLGSAATGTYTVRRGDTLSGIASRTGVSAAALAKSNGLSNPHLVVVGTRLSIPGAVAPTTPRTHRVAAGDTLAAIAARYGVTPAALAAANGLANPNR